MQDWRPVCNIPRHNCIYTKLFLEYQLLLYETTLDCAVLVVLSAQHKTSHVPKLHLMLQDGHTSLVDNQIPSMLGWLYAYIRFVADVEAAQKLFKVLNQRNCAKGASWRYYKDIRMGQGTSNRICSSIKKASDPIRILFAYSSVVVNTLKLSSKSTWLLVGSWSFFV